MSVRQSIIEALESRLADIDGVKTVATWRVTDFSPAEYPVVHIKDTVDLMPSDGAIGKIDHELTVEISVLFYGAASGQGARDLVADVVASIGTDSTFGGLAYDTVIQSVTLEPDASGKLLSSATIDTTIYYRTSTWSI